MRNTPASSPGEKYLLITLKRACAKKFLLRVEKNDEKNKKLFIGKKRGVGKERERCKRRSERVGKDGYKSKCLYWT